MSEKQTTFSAELKKALAGLRYAASNPTLSSEEKQVILEQIKELTESIFKSALSE